MSRIDRIGFLLKSAQTIGGLYNGPMRNFTENMQGGVLTKRIPSAPFGNPAERRTVSYDDYTKTGGYEALRNVVAVGADPDHCAILDNFCWGNTAKPDRLGGLVRAAFGCRDAALALELREGVLGPDHPRTLLDLERLP